MQAADFAKYIETPHALKQSDIADLQRIVKDFPYFQAAHMLLSIASGKWDASIYQQSLKRTAIVATHRAHLYNLLHEETPAEISTEEKNKEPGTELATVKTTAGTEETAKAELDVLKAAELSVASAETAQSAAPVHRKPEEILEQEIGKQVVTAFVEKEIIKTPELHRPPAQVANEPASFGDWLSFLKKNNGQSYSEIEEQVSGERAKRQAKKAASQEAQITAPDDAVSKKEKQRAIMDKIIEKNPGLIRTKEEQKFYAPDLKARESLRENEHLVTETLARIYALQGNVNKAVRAYEILSLKYPQKSAYFASLIQKLKNNQNQ